MAISEYGQPYVNAISDAGALAFEGALAPVMTVWANDHPNSVGKRVGAMTSTVLPLSHAIEGYHIGSIAAALGVPVAAVALPLGAVAGGLLLYNGKKLIDILIHKKKAERAEKFGKHFTQDELYRELAEDAWETEKGNLTDKQRTLLGNVNNLRIEDIYERVRELQKDRVDLQETTPFYKKLLPSYHLQKRHARKDAETVEQMWVPFADSLEKTYEETRKQSNAEASVSVIGSQ